MMTLQVFCLSPCNTCVYSTSAPETTVVKALKLTLIVKQEINVWVAMNFIFVPEYVDQMKMVIFDEQCDSGI